MSLETLKEDLRANLAQVATLSATSTVEDIVTHLKETLWPTIEAIVDETEEIDECVADLVGGHEDILHPDTAQVFAAVIAGATAVAAALKLRIDKTADAALMKVVAELESNVKKANELMQEIVIDDGSDLEDEDEEDEDDGDADDDEDEQEKK